LTRGGLRSRPDRAAIAGRGPQARVKGPTESNDTNPDDQSGESTADMRYFVHQDRQPLTHRVPLCGTDHEAIAGLCPERCVKGSWNVVALTEYDPNDTNNGRIAERYSYTPYGSFLVLTGDSGNGELDSVRLTSTTGNTFGHQGLAFDLEKGNYQNRNRVYLAVLHRFGQRDPLGHSEGSNLYSYVAGSPRSANDPTGLYIVGGRQRRRCCVASSPHVVGTECEFVRTYGPYLVRTVVDPCDCCRFVYGQGIIRWQDVGVKICNQYLTYDLYDCWNIVEIHWLSSCPGVPCPPPATIRVPLPSILERHSYWRCGPCNCPFGWYDCLPESLPRRRGAPRPPPPWPPVC